MRNRQRLQAETLRKEEEDTLEAVVVECAVDTAGDADTVGAGGLGPIFEVAGSYCVGEVSAEGWGLFFPEADGGEGGLGMLKEGREPRTYDHLLIVEFCGDSDREQWYPSAWRINVHDRSRLAWQNWLEARIRVLRYPTSEKEMTRTGMVSSPRRKRRLIILREWMAMKIGISLRKVM